MEGGVNLSASATLHPRAVMREQLESHLKKIPTAPFLFVGSGFSRRYRGTPTWEELLRHFAGKTQHSYDYYRASAGSSLPSIAAAIAKSFHDVWWASEEYGASRREFASATISPESALKIEVARYLSQAEPLALSDSLRKEAEALGSSVIDGIITTNWDAFLEQTFPDFHPYIGQDQLLFAAPQGIGEIYKVHGCITAPSSLVLTDADYQKFDERNAYLAAKLLTVFVEHPVIFLGYSLTDPNVTQILRDIGRCLTSSNIGQLRDRLIFVSWDPNQTEPTLAGGNIVVPDGYAIPILEIRTASFQPIFEVLANLPRAFPARVLRRLKEHVYTLVRDNDPKGRLYVKDIDQIAEVDPDVEVVFGVGAIGALKEIGYRGLKRSDLIGDILNQNKDYDPNKVLCEVMPVLLKSTGIIPIFRYLKLSGRMENGELVNDSGLDPKIAKMAKLNLTLLKPPQHYRKQFSKTKEQWRSLEEFMDAHTPEDVVMYGVLYVDHNTDPKRLLAFLKQNEARLMSSHTLHQVQYIKLVCAYDWLVNGR